MSRDKPSQPSDEPCEHGAASPSDGRLRCACGSMLARYVPGGVELKCRRCKRIVIVPVDGEPVDCTG